MRPGAYGPPTNIRSDVTITVSHDVGCPVYTVEPRGGAADKQVIYAHGGGWVHEIRPQHWALIARIAAEAEASVTVPIYPLLPHGSARQVNDLWVALCENLHQNRPNIQLAGDSAGGQITLSAAQTLRDRGCAGIRTVLISPAADLTFSNPRSAQLQPRDPWLALEGIRELARMWASEATLVEHEGGVHVYPLLPTRSGRCARSLIIDALRR